MPSSLSELPPLPRWRLEQERQDAIALYGKVMKGWVGAKMSEQSASFLVDEVTDYFGLTGYAQMSALVDFFVHSIGVTITEKIAMRVAAQLVGNKKSLIAAEPVSRFEGVKEPQWVPFFIEGVEPCQFGQKVGMALKLLCVAGPYSGYTAVKKCPVRFLARIAYSIGFSKQLLYDEPDDLLGMFLAGYILPSSKEELDFKHYSVTASMKKHNRENIKQRRGLDG